MDDGAQSNVATEKCAKWLNLRQIHCNLPVTGICEVSAETYRMKTTFQIRSWCSSFKLDITVIPLLLSLESYYLHSKFIKISAG